MEITFTVHSEPYGKGRPRFRKDGHTYTPEKTKAYEKLVQTEYIAQTGGVMLAGPIKAMIYARFGVNKSDTKKAKAEKLAGEILPTKKPDCDNIAKTVLDALNGVAYLDDSQIVRLKVDKDYGEPARVVVNLIEI